MWGKYLINSYTQKCISLFCVINFTHVLVEPFFIEKLQFFFGLVYVTFQKERSAWYIYSFTRECVMLLNFETRKHIMKENTGDHQNPL